jgi:hypothetical protein
MIDETHRVRVTLLLPEKGAAYAGENRAAHLKNDWMNSMAEGERGAVQFCSDPLLNPE